VADVFVRRSLGMPGWKARLRTRVAQWMWRRSAVLGVAVTLFLGARARARTGVVVFAEELQPGDRFLVSVLEPERRRRRR
jgi:hypothetical protein